MRRRILGAKGIEVNSRIRGRGAAKRQMLRLGLGPRPHPGWKVAQEKILRVMKNGRKLVLAQKMLEEIRRRQPFLTQRELVDEEADEAHECRYIQLLEASTCLLPL